MATPPIITTKIERVVEAFENMAISAAAKDHEAVLAARQECAEALREFLAPTIRLATNDGERVA
jgi:hypothetical protein